MDVHDLTAAYALHALDAEEREAYEAHLGQCRRCRDELAALTEAAAALAWGVESPPPPPALRERILGAAAAGRANVAPLRPRSRLWPAAPAAAACAAIGLAVWGTTLSRSLDRERAHASALGIVADPASRKVRVHGHAGTVAIAPDGEGVLVVRDLAPAPSGMTYEAWVIPAGGSPHRAGVFDGGGRMTMVKLGMKVPRGAVVAATVEREGGVDAPTQQPMLTAQA